MIRIGASSDDAHRRELAELDAARRDRARDDDRQRLRLAAAEDQRERELVPREDEHEDRRRDDARAHQRQDHLLEHLPRPVAVRVAGGLQIARDLPDEDAQHPDVEREVERHVGDDQPGLRLEQVELLVDQEERDDHRHRRRHPRGEDEHHHVVAPAHLQPRERVRGGGADQHHERVLMPATISELTSPWTSRAVRERGREVSKIGVKKKSGGRANRLSLRAGRDRERPQDGEDEDDRQDARNSVRSQRAAVVSRDIGYPSEELQRPAEESVDE